MSYGIEINNANSNLIIDSVSTNSGFIVTDYVTSASTISGINFDEEMLFIKPVATTGNHNICVHRTSGNSGQAQNATFRNEAGSAINCQYVRGKFAKSFTAASTGYGLQVFNSSGDLAFDSGAYAGDGGFGITNYFAYQSMSGDMNLMDTDRSKFVLGNTLLGDTNNSDFFIGIYYVNDPSSLPTGVSAATAGIYFNAFINFFGGKTTINNLGAQFLGERGSV